MAEIHVSDLTQGKGSLTGTGVFDELMRATETHIQQEYSKGRIKGTDYATVYLGAMQAVMDRSLQFLLQQQRTDLEAQLMQEQIATEKLNQLQVTQQTANLVSEQNQIEAQTLQVQSQTALTDQQKANLAAEALNIPKQGTLLDKQVAQLNSEIARSDAQTLQVHQQTDNLAAEALNIPKQGAMLDAQTAVQKQQELNLGAEKFQIESQTKLTDQQTANAITENTVLKAQECKLRAEFDLLQEQMLKTVSETALLNQKKATEQAQTSSTNVDPHSMIGQQTRLHKNQADGFFRDSEQKAAKLLADVFQTRLTVDGVGDANDAGLGNANIKRAVEKMLASVESADTGSV